MSETIEPGAAPTLREFCAAWAEEIRTVTLPAVQQHAQWAREALADAQECLRLTPKDGQ